MKPRRLVRTIAAVWSLVAVFGLVCIFIPGTTFLPRVKIEPPSEQVCDTGQIEMAQLDHTSPCHMAWKAQLQYDGNCGTWTFYLDPSQGGRAIGNDSTSNDWFGVRPGPLTCGDKTHGQ